MVEQGTKQVYRNVYLKGFILPDKDMTTSFLKAWNVFTTDNPVRMNIHVMGYGDWKTSEIIGYGWKRGQLCIETKHCTYVIVGKEHVKRVKSFSIIVPDREKALTSMKKDDMERLAKYVSRGAHLHAYVIRRDGGSSITSSIVKVNTFRKRFITESGSIYSW